MLQAHSPAMGGKKMARNTRKQSPHDILLRIRAPKSGTRGRGDKASASLYKDIVEVRLLGAIKNNSA